MTMTVSSLESRGILEVQGPDSQKFLHGQCTADVQNLSPGQWRLGGFCTPKGRLYANFYLLALAEDHYWLIMPQSMVAPTIERVQKYAAFFRTELQDSSKHCHGMAFHRDQAKPGQPEDLALTVSEQEVVMGMPEGHTLVWLNPLQENHYERVMHSVETDAQCLPEVEWDRWETRFGLAWVLPSTVEAYIPQALSWDALGGVSFSKGCYTGQEVVARLHYKGVSKKNLRHVSGNGEVPAVTAAVTGADGSNLGQLVRVVPTSSGWIGLAVLNSNSDDKTPVQAEERPVELGDWVNSDDEE